MLYPIRNKPILYYTTCHIVLYISNSYSLINLRAEYQEWPMRGIFKHRVSHDSAYGVRYGMEFSLEDVQQLCAAAFPLHTSSAGSNASFSARPSRSKRPRF